MAIFRESSEVQGNLSVRDDFNFGTVDSAATIKVLQAAGSQPNIGFDFNVKGTGVIRVPTGYEANITAEPRALVNKAYADGRMGGMQVTSLVTSPGLGQNGYAITWDNTAGQYTLTASGFTTGQGITLAPPSINLGGAVTQVTTDVNLTVAGDIYVRSNFGTNPAGFRAQATSLNNNQAIMYGGGVQILAKFDQLVVTANVTGAMQYGADYSGVFNATRSIPDIAWTSGHVGTKLLTAAAQTPAGGQDGWALYWDNTAGKYGLKSVSGSAMAIGGGITTSTPKSVLYVDASGTLAQDVANFNWDYTNKYLGVGIATPTAFVHVGAGTTTKPAFKMTAGVALTTIAAGVQDGAWEYTGTHLNFIIGSTRYQLDQQTGAPAWLLASGGTLTGVNTITSNANGQLNFNGTWTAAGNNNFHTDFTGSFTGRAGQAADTLVGYRFTPTLTTGTNAQTLNAVLINPTFVGTGTFNALRIQSGGVDIATFQQGGSGGVIKLGNVPPYFCGITITSDTGSIYYANYGGVNQVQTFTRTGAQGGGIVDILDQLAPNSTDALLKVRNNARSIFSVSGDGNINTFVSAALASTTGTQASSYVNSFQTSLWTGSAEVKGWSTWRDDANTGLNLDHSLGLYFSTGASPSFTANPAVKFKTDSTIAFFNSITHTIGPGAGGGFAGGANDFGINASIGTGFGFAQAGVVKLYYSNVGTFTVSGLNLSIGAMSQSNLNITLPATANNDFYFNFTGTFTSRNTASDTMYAYKFTPTMSVNAGAPASQVHYGVYIAPTFTGTATQWALGVSGKTLLDVGAGTTDNLRLSVANSIGSVWMRFMTSNNVNEYGRWQSGGNSVDYIGGQFRLNFTGVNANFTQSNNPTGWEPAFTVTPGVHTAMTAGTEFVMNVFAASTQTWAAGSTTLADQRYTRFRGATVNAGAGNTITNSYTVHIEAPINGSGTTPNLYGLGVTTGVAATNIFVASARFTGSNSAGGGFYGIEIGNQVTGATESLRIGAGNDGTGQGYWIGSSTNTRNIYFGGTIGSSGPTSYQIALTASSLLWNQNGVDATVSAANQKGSYEQHFKSSLWTGAAEQKGWFSWRADASTATNSVYSLNLYQSTGASPTFGNNIASFNNQGFFLTNNIFRLAVAALNITGQSSIVNSLNFTTTGTFSLTSGNNIMALFDALGNTSTGTTAYDIMQLKQTVNGTANGLYRSISIVPTFTAWGGDVTGIDYNPTVTSITGTHLSFRATSGSVLIGGTTITNASTLLDLQSTTKAMKVSAVTNIASVATPANGMITYDAATNLFNFRQNSAWVTGIGGGGSSAGINTEVQLSNGAGGFVAGGMTWAANVFTVGINTNASTLQTITTIGSTTTPTALTIRPMSSATTAIAGSTLTLSGGNATVGNADGGAVNITGGAPFGTGAPGTVNINGSNAVGSAIAGGSVLITGGTGGTGNAAGGIVTIKGGTPVGTGLAGTVTVVGGQPVGSGITGGSVNIIAGDGSSTGNSNGGVAQLNGGIGSGSGNGGVAQVNGGSVFGTGAGGEARVVGGGVSGTGTAAGAAKLIGGSSAITGVNAGDAIVNGGSGSVGNVNGGNVQINAGTGNGTGVVGVIKVQGFTSFSVSAVVPNVLADINGGLAIRQSSPGSIGADQNDYAIGAGTSFRLTPTGAARTLTGLTGGFDGKILVIRNVGAVNLVFAHENASSTAANRITSSTAANITILPNGVLTLQYDSTASRWFDIAVR